MSEQDAPLALDGMQRKVVTGSIMVATIMQTLDSTIANVALPHMQGSFSSTQEQTAWVLTSYIVAAAIATPPARSFPARSKKSRPRSSRKRPGD